MTESPEQYPPRACCGSPINCEHVIDCPNYREPHPLLAAQRPEQPVTHGRWPQCGAVGTLYGLDGMVATVRCDKPVGHDRMRDTPFGPGSTESRAHRVILEWTDAPDDEGEPMVEVPLTPGRDATLDENPDVEEAAARCGVSVADDRPNAARCRHLAGHAGHHSWATPWGARDRLADEHGR